MHINITTIANQFPAKFALEITHAIVLIRSACSTKVAQMITVFSTPLENVPRQNLIRYIGAEVSVHASVPTINSVLVQFVYSTLLIARTQSKY